MPEGLVSKLDDLIGIGGRIANARERVEVDLADLASSASMMRGEVAALDAYAHSRKMDMESLVNTTHSIFMAIT